MRSDLGRGVPGPVGRRGLLCGSLAAAAGLALSGCGRLLPGETREPRPPTADELAVARAVGDAVRLRDAALALGAAQSRLGGLCRRIAAEHDQHLQALGATGPDVTATPTPSGAAVPANARGQRDGELEAGRAALRDAVAAAPGPAVLLARIAAARVVHADLIAAAGRTQRPADEVEPAGPAPGATAPAGTGPTAAGGVPAPSATARPLTEADVSALGRLLAGEHAAVFAYPIVVARCSPGKRETATALWQAHVAERDSLERLLVAAGGDPPAAAPAYDVGPVPTTNAAAAELGAAVERGLAAAAVTAVGRTTGESRLLAARRLITAARRTATWAGSGTALPGGEPVAERQPTPTP